MKKKEGRKRGIFKEGRTVGRKNGKMEGRKEGRKDGRKEGISKKERKAYKEERNAGT